MCLQQSNQQKLGNCGKNPAGLQIVGYFAYADDIQTWPAVIPNPQTAAEQTTLAGNFVMKTGKSFTPVYNTKDKGIQDDEAIGPIDGKQFKTTMTGFVPGINEDRLAHAINSLNARVVYVAMNKLGKRRVVGTQGNPSNVETLKLSSGGSPEDLSGMEYMFSTEGAEPALFYNGNIPSAIATTIPNS